MNEKYIRFTTKDSKVPVYGLLENDKVIALSSAPYLGTEKTDETYNLKDIKLKAPVEPSKIICIGLNYHAHVKASQSADKAPEYPLIFLKPPSSIIGPEENIIHPEQSERVDYEAELGVVIGKTARKVS